MRDEESVSRFYGLTVGSEVTDAIDEGLTDPGEADLVAAHLKNNYSYFGAIDKTLAGFVVLDDEGDNYTLLDQRGDGRVWWQDHETRELECRFDSLSDWSDFEAEVDNDGDEHELLSANQPSGPAPAAEQPSRCLTTPMLAERYQWLVWLLAQPLRDRDGKPTQSDEDLAGSAIGHLRSVFPTTQAEVDQLRSELPELAGDPHLAIYWLLHTALLAQDDEHEQVLIAIGDTSRSPLLDAFATGFGRLALEADLSLLPGFRDRRSMALMYTGGEDAAGRGPTAVRALRVAPQVWPLMKTLLIRQGLETGTVTDADLVDALGHLPESADTAALRALIEQRAGATESQAADEFVRAAAGFTEAWPAFFELFWQLHPLVRDTEAFVAAVKFLLRHDPHHRRVLLLAQAAQRMAGREVFLAEAELDRAVELGEESATVLQQLTESPQAWSAAVEAIADPQLVRIVARRVLFRADKDEYCADVIAWAIRTVLASDDSDRAELAADGFARVPAEEQNELLARFGAEVTSAEHPFVETMLRVLENDAEPDDNDFMASYTMEEMKEEVLHTLAPFAAEPPIFDRLMQMAESNGPRTTVEPLWNELFSPFEKETYVLSRLDDAQATRAARAMVANKLNHPNIHVRNAAGHQLYYFTHVGAEDYFIDALVEFGDRYAASSAQLDPEQDERLGDLLSDLYSAVRRMNTAKSRTVLIDRLFTERREFWRMGNAIGEVFNPQVQAEIMRSLVERPDGRAAGCYAFALADFVKKDPAKVELLELLVTWSVPDDEIARRFFKYALVVGIEGALSAKQFELVRRGHELATAIAEPPLEPDNHARGTTWNNPLETSKLSRRLAEIVSGSADEKRRRLIDKGVAARAAGRPRRKIGDEALGILAGVTVSRRLLHDQQTGEVWFFDSDKKLHAFDGYEIVGPPFRADSLANGRLNEFLVGVAEISERALFWNRAGDTFVELIRFGDRLVCRWGRNDQSPIFSRTEQVGLAFPDETAAADAFFRLKPSIAATGLVESSPWYLSGKGAIVRKYSCPIEGSWQTDDVRLNVFEGGLKPLPLTPSDQIHQSREDPEAVLRHQRRELELMRDLSAHLSRLEWSQHCRHSEDMTVGEWIRQRIRDDSRDAAWHVRALCEVVDYLRAYGFADLISALEVEVGTGVSDAEIAAFEAGRSQPVPDVLRAFWREIGYASWSTGQVGMRILSPAQMLERRSAAGALGEAYLSQLTPDEAEQSRPLLGALDVLVEETTGSSILAVMADHAISDSDGRVFTHAYQKKSDLWWTSLSWTFATRFLDSFADAVESAAPVIAQLYCGQRLNPAAQRRYFERRATGRSGRFWELYRDDAAGVVSTRSGKVGTVGTVRTRRYPDPARAARKADKLVAAKQSEGYAEVDRA